MLREFFVVKVNSSGPMTDEELLTAILNWHPEDDPAMLISRAYNRITELREALTGIIQTADGARYADDDDLSYLVRGIEDAANGALGC